MKAQDKIKQTRLALEVIRESEAIRLRLAGSFRSGTSADVFAGVKLDVYFRSMKRNLLIELLIQSLKMASGALYKAITTILRATWLKIAKAVKANA